MSVRFEIPENDGVYFITFTAASPELYIHSSARFYATGEQSIYEVINYMYLQDIDLTKREE